MWAAPIQLPRLQQATIPLDGPSDTAAREWARERRRSAVGSPISRGDYGEDAARAKLRPEGTVDATPIRNKTSNDRGSSVIRKPL